MLSKFQLKNPCWKTLVICDSYARSKCRGFKGKQSECINLKTIDLRLSCPNDRSLDIYIFTLMKRTLKSETWFEWHNEWLLTQRMLTRNLFNVYDSEKMQLSPCLFDINFPSLPVVLALSEMNSGMMPISASAKDVRNLPSVRVDTSSVGLSVELQPYLLWAECNAGSRCLRKLDSHFWSQNNFLLFKCCH